MYYVGRLCTILISKKRPVLFKAISFLALSHDCLYNDIFRKAICMLLGGVAALAAAVVSNLHSIGCDGNRVRLSIGGLVFFPGYIF